MIEVRLLNKDNKVFTKIFDSPYLLKRFLIKVKKSKKLTLLSVIHY